MVEAQLVVIFCFLLTVCQEQDFRALTVPKIIFLEYR